MQKIIASETAICLLIFKNFKTMQMQLKRNAKSVVKLIGLIFETTNSVA